MTNLVIKPRIDRLVNQEIAGTLATANGDPILTSIHFSLDEDARWHRAWTAALLRHLIDDTPANAEVVSGWIEKWSPLASRALEALAGIVAEAPVPLDASAAATRIIDDVSRETDSMLKAPPLPPHREVGPLRPIRPHDHLRNSKRRTEWLFCGSQASRFPSQS